MSYEAFVESVEEGSSEIISLLLKDGRVDPSVNDNEPLRIAEEKGNEEVISLLLEDKRVQVKLRS